MPRIVYDSKPGDEPIVIEAGRTIVFQPKGEVWERKPGQVIKEFADAKNPKKIIQVKGKKLMKTGKKGRLIDVQDLTEDEWRIAALGKHNPDGKLKHEAAYRETIGVDELELQIRELQEELKSKRSKEPKKVEEKKE